MTAMAAGSGRVRTPARIRLFRAFTSITVVAVAAGGIGVAVSTKPPSDGIGVLLFVAGALPLTTATVVALMIVAAGPPTWFRAWLSIGMVVFVASATAGTLASLLPPELLWVDHAVTILSIFGFLPVGYFFPTGLPVPKWSRWLILGWAGLAALALSFPWNPFPPIPLVVLGVASALMILSVLGCQALRYRRATVAERQQVKWVLLALALVAAEILAIMSFPPGALAGSVALQTVFSLTGAISITALSVAIGFAMLHYRLFDVDLVIARAVALLAVSLFVAIVYGVVIGAVGFGWPRGTPLVLPVIATALAALGVAPVHRWVRRRMNRWLYGDREDPATVLGRLSGELSRSAELASTLERLATTLHDALRVDAVVVEAGDARVRAGDPSDDGFEVLPLVFEQREVGRIRIRPLPGDRLGARDARLLDQVAASAGAAVHAALVGADLQRSRAALVAAREQERARLHRELHDGIGPTLASVGQRMGHAAALLDSDRAGAARVLASARDGVLQAMVELRSVVTGLRPPALEQLGLEGALLAAWAGTTSPVVRIRCTPVGLPPAVEVAAYRIAMEAVGNAVRHSGAARCEVGIEIDGPDVRIRIEDDGVGSAHSNATGSGLRTMRERAEELGGSLDVVELHPGTSVEAVLPRGGVS